MDTENRDQIIDPHMDCECGKESPNEPPLYLLHYDDVHFINPHYQSIRPKPNNNIKLPMRVNNLQRNVCLFLKKHLSSSTYIKEIFYHVSRQIQHQVVIRLQYCQEMDTLHQFRTSQ